MGKILKFAEKLTATQSMSSIIVAEKKHILGKQRENKVRINQHIKVGVSACNFMRHVYVSGIKNNRLEKPLFSLNIMLQLNKSGRLEIIEKHFHLKSFCANIFVAVYFHLKFLHIYIYIYIHVYIYI